MVKVASVQLESPLIALDRLFDYQIPEELIEEAQPGVRVKVPFRTQELNGFIVKTSENSDFSGKLDSITQVISEIPVLREEIYELAVQIAKRYVSTVSAVLKLAVPSRAVRVEKQWLKDKENSVDEDFRLRHTAAIQKILENAKPEYSVTASEILNASARLYLEPIPFLSVQEKLPPWIHQFVLVAAAALADRKSVIICVPSWREISLLENAFTDAGLVDSLIRTDAKQSQPERYKNFLNALSDDPKILLGNRSVLLAPAKNLGAILVWDEADSAHEEMMAPYYNSRIIAMQRAEQQHCALIFSSHSRSAEIQRLLDIGWLVPLIPTPRKTPNIVLDNSSFASRIPSMSFAAIREGLERGSVLVQVRAGKNHSSGEYNSSELAAELGKAFPGKRVIVSDAQHPVLEAPSEKAIVIAAAGSEPIVSCGYQCVVILDGVRLLARDGLRIREEAMRSWMNAASLVNESGRVVLAGVDGNIARNFATWNSERLAKEELQSRIPLGMPPVRRSLSITSSKPKLRQVEAMLPKNTSSFWVADGNNSKLVVLFDYRQSEELSLLFRSILVKDAAGGKTKNIDKIRLRFDDPEVF